VTCPVATGYHRVEYQFSLEVHTVRDSLWRKRSLTCDILVCNNVTERRHRDAMAWIFWDEYVAKIAVQDGGFR